jgi:hypothetical protein
MIECPGTTTMKSLDSNLPERLCIPRMVELPLFVIAFRTLSSTVFREIPVPQLIVFQMLDASRVGKRKSLTKTNRLFAAALGRTARAARYA